MAALAASEAPNGRVLSLCLAAMGACASIYHPVGMSLISHTIDARGRALGVNGMFGNAAIALTPLVTATLCDAPRLAADVSRRSATRCAPSPSPARSCRVDERRHQRPAAPAAAPPRRAGAAAVRRAARRRHAWPASAIAATRSCSPATSPRACPEIGFGAATSLAYVVGIGGQYVGGVLADRYDLRRLYLVFHAVSLPALLLMTALSGLPLVGGAAVFVFFSLGMQPIENSLFAQFTPPRWRATAYGVKFVLTFGVGSLAVWLVRWADAGGGLVVRAAVRSPGWWRW